MSNNSDNEAFSVIIWEEVKNEYFCISKCLPGLPQKCYDVKIVPKSDKIAFLCQCEKYLNDVVFKLFSIKCQHLLTNVTLCFPYRIFDISAHFITLGGRDNILTLKIENLEKDEKIRNRGFLTNDQGYQHLSKIKFCQSEIVAFHRNDKYLSRWEFLPI